MADIILQSGLVDEVWFIPCFAHPSDKELAPVEHRLQMAKFLEGEGVKISDIEIARRRKSYTIDTVRALQAEYPSYEFFWIIGSDIVATKSYLKWKDWNKLRRLVKFLVGSTPDITMLY